MARRPNNAHNGHGGRHRKEKPKRPLRSFTQGMGFGRKDVKGQKPSGKDAKGGSP